MQSTREELFETIHRIQGISVLVVGDLILDRYIWGTVERISPEAPVPVVLVKRGEDRLGGAGNVVRNLCNLGVKVSVCGLIGDDDEGRAVLSLMDREGVEKEGVLTDRSRSTTLKTRVIAHSQQVVRIDRESPSAPPAIGLAEGIAAYVDQKLDSCQAVIVSDYGKGAISETILKRLHDARKAGRLGLEQRPYVLDPHPRNYNLYKGISIAKPNRKEAESAAGMKITDRTSAMKAAQALLQRWKAEMMLITLGEGGLVIATEHDDEGIHLETVARTVFDVSGAGDTVTAVFSSALASGASPRIAGDLANIAAGVVVSEVGTVAISVDKLKQEIDRLAGGDAKKEGPCNGR